MAVLIKALGLLLTTGLLVLLLKRTVPELAGLLSMAAVAVVLLAAASYAAGLRDAFVQMEKLLPNGTETMLPLVKCAGIGVVTKLGAGLCRDAGQGAAATALELLGTVCALAVALPLLQGVLKTVGGFM